MKCTKVARRKLFAQATLLIGPVGSPAFCSQIGVRSDRRAMVREAEAEFRWDRRMRV